jgi:hypothetical protein
MREIPARVFRRAVSADLGLALKEDASEDDQRSGMADLASVDAYLSHFCPDAECLNCGAKLGGMFGSFEWGLTHGEGHCSNCGYPARGYHTIPGREHKPILNHMPFIRQYHPEALRDRDGRRISLSRLNEVFPPADAHEWEVV